LPGVLDRNDSLGYAGERDQAGAPPVFVVTHSVPDKVRLGDRFTFVTDGLEGALGQARAAAGVKDVLIMGGGNISCEFLRAGLVDVLSLHVAPVVLGEGTPLFSANASLRLELLGSESTDAAEHLTYRVVNDA
jgi:dihydrofolate reductase